MNDNVRGACICLPCRRVIKVPRWRWQDTRCPECRALMRWAGFGFRAPRREARDQWRKLQILLQAGYRFWRETGRHQRPEIKTLAQTKRFVAILRVGRDPWAARTLGRGRQS